MKPFNIAADIRQAHTLPAEVYHDPAVFAQSLDHIFARSWQCLGLTSDLRGPGTAHPFFLLPDTLKEPLLLATNSVGQTHCLSNVCTHRGNLLVERTSPCHEIRCRYHGRRFGLDGQMKSMPEFEGVANFPSPADNLPQLPLERLGPLLFTHLQPSLSFAQWMGPIQERMAFMPIEDLSYAEGMGGTYEIAANWALYVDNFLEGFHIPFVHPGLNAQLSYPDYTYELFEGGNLQIGIAKKGEACFQIPAGHQDAGKRVAAYYFWLFPNLMLNFYPWGLSLNLVSPLGPERTKVRFEAFTWPGQVYDSRLQAALHQTELEDEAVVQSVQTGMKSRLYHRGRYSPKMEPTLHHFHRLWAAAMASASPERAAKSPLIQQHAKK